MREMKWSLLSLLAAALLSQVAMADGYPLYYSCNQVNGQTTVTMVVINPSAITIRGSLFAGDYDRDPQLDPIEGPEAYFQGTEHSSPTKNDFTALTGKLTVPTEDLSSNQAVSSPINLDGQPFTCTQISPAQPAVSAGNATRE